MSEFRNQELKIELDEKIFEMVEIIEDHEFDIIRESEDEIVILDGNEEVQEIGRLINEMKRITSLQS